MANELPIGTRRQGDLIDFSATPQVQVSLERDERGISVVVPWRDQDSPYASWFLSDGFFSHRPPVEVPRRLLFQDSHGSVLLVGCYARGFHAAMSGPGSGRVLARYAVLGVAEDLDFEHVTGVEAEVSGLREWLGIASITLRPGYMDGETVITVTARAADAIDIPEVGMSLQPRSGLDYGPGRDTWVLSDQVLCEVNAAAPTDWDDLARPPRALRDLLLLSRWRNESFVITRMQHPNDPLRTVDGEEHGPQWREVVQRDDQKQDPPTGHSPHLIQYGDIGRDGLVSWISLRESFARALDPIVSTRFLEGVTPLTLMAQAGPGLEALGYLLFTRDGTPAKTAAKSSLRERLDRIGSDIDGSVPFQVDDWAAKTTEVYNAVKHANRTAPLDLDILNSWRESVLAVRAWVALELGVTAANVASRLQHDQQSLAYETR